ncbi:ATP-binding cassette domain-containing protein [Geoglobus acetivorans]|uniref:ATP-binding cassette domain-containing protein n=1 Tax=Geoglobus acetivorans TaxID=565033 RepID=A0ABZ3H1V5_GEOAI|nr:ABC transporter ATP-binding protein [Geoglobus acetivorans]
MLEVVDVSKVYNGNVVLKSVNLTVKDFVGIHGPNGSGKSTLLSIIAGLEKPSCGRIIFQGQDVTGMSAEKLVKMGVAIVFQIPRPFKRLTVAENIVAASLLRKNHDEAEKSAYRICKFVGLDEVADSFASQLSQGELKLLEIGRALATEPKLLLLDEPFSGLDIENARRVVRLVERIKSRGVDGIITAHRTKLLRNVADICYEMRGGKIAEG